MKQIEQRGGFPMKLNTVGNWIYWAIMIVAVYMAVRSWKP